MHGLCVDDSMEGPEALRLLALRAMPSAMLLVSPYTSASSAPGHSDQKGEDELVASGPSRLPACIDPQRGFRRAAPKNGACVIHSMLHDLEEFVDAKRHELPWIKRCIDITPEWWNDLSEALQEKILAGIQAGDLWLNRIKYDVTVIASTGTSASRSSSSRGTCCSSTLTSGSVEGDLRKLLPRYVPIVRSPRTHRWDDTGEYLSPKLTDRLASVCSALLTSSLSTKFLMLHSVKPSLQSIEEKTLSRLLQWSWPQSGWEQLPQQQASLVRTAWYERLQSPLPRRVRTATRISKAIRQPRDRSAD